MTGETSSVLAGSETDTQTKPKKKKSRVRDRGIDTFYRDAYLTLNTQNEIADGKANIMISVNGILLSALVITSPFTHKLGMLVIMPIVVLACATLVSLIFCLVAATPRTQGTEADDKKSPLFFGDFTTWSEDDYVERMRRIRQDRELPYDLMSEHLYRMGTVLKRKFDMLRIAFSAFLAGLIVSAGVLFVVALGSL